MVEKEWRPHGHGRPFTTIDFVACRCAGRRKHHTIWALSNSPLRSSFGASWPRFPNRLLVLPSRLRCLWREGRWGRGAEFELKDGRVGWGGAENLIFAASPLAPCGTGALRSSGVRGATWQTSLHNPQSGVLLHPIAQPRPTPTNLLSPHPAKSTFTQRRPSHLRRLGKLRFSSANGGHRDGTDGHSPRFALNFRPSTKS